MEVRTGVSSDEENLRVYRRRRRGGARSNSYRRGRWNAGLWYPLVVARRRSTAGRRGQKEGGAPWRHVAGGPRHPHTGGPRRCRATPTRPLTDAHLPARVEGRRTPTPARLLTVDSIAGGVLMEAEICDLDELTSGQRGQAPTPAPSATPAPALAAAAASRALF